MSSRSSGARETGDSDGFLISVPLREWFALNHPLSGVPGFFSVSWYPRVTRGRTAGRAPPCATSETALLGLTAAEDLRIFMAHRLARIFHEFRSDITITALRD